MITPELARLREDIEQLDHALIRLIGDRVRLAREIGAAKRAAGLSYDDEVRQIVWQLIGLSRRVQTNDA